MYVFVVPGRGAVLLGLPGIKMLHLQSMNCPTINVLQKVNKLMLFKRKAWIQYKNIKQSNNLPKVILILNSYWVPKKVLDNDVSDELTKQLCNDDDVFTGISSLKGIFTLQLNVEGTPYHAPPRYKAYCCNNSSDGSWKGYKNKRLLCHVDESS